MGDCLGRRPKLMLDEEERKRLIENPPRNAWIEKKGDYIYLRWREAGEQLSVRITEEEERIVREKLGRPRRKARVEIPSLEEFIDEVKRLAEEGNEDAQKLLKRYKKEKATVKRVLRLLSLIS